MKLDIQHLSPPAYSLGHARSLTQQRRNNPFPALTRERCSYEIGYVVGLLASLDVWQPLDSLDGNQHDNHQPREDSEGGTE